MTYDDLKSPAVCRFKQQVLAIPPSEVHLLLWESRPATISLADLPPKPLAALTKPSSPPPSVVQSFVRSSAFVSSAISTAERRASTSAAILATDASPLPVGRLSLSAVPPRTTSTGPRRPVAPQVFVGPTPPAASSEDRLQRARERFLRDKQGVLGSTVGTVIPSPMSAVSNVSAAFVLGVFQFLSARFRNASGLTGLGPVAASVGRLTGRYTHP
jgi:hypothetical protein